MEKCIFPNQNSERSTISHLLPKLPEDDIDDGLDLLLKSSVIDGTEVKGHGIVQGHSYGWKMAIESEVKSIAVIPDRFFDIKGKSYPIDQARKVSVSSLPTYVNFKDAVIYRINNLTPLAAPDAKIIFDDAMEGGVTADTSSSSATATTESGEENTVVNYQQNRTFKSLFYTQTEARQQADQLGTICNINGAHKETCEAQYLAIIVDNNDNYYALIGVDTNVVDEYGDIEDTSTTSSTTITWHEPKTPIDVTQFKNIDMWLRFDSINALSYFLITKYIDDIAKIVPVDINPTTVTYPSEDARNDSWSVNQNITEVAEGGDGAAKKLEGKLWAYINPRTMQPYADDYWFHQGEPFYVKSLTIAPKGKRIKGNKITVRADQWPGMYMMVGETYIRSRDTGEDERMQIKFPLCKVRSDHTLTLQADGDPTTFNLNLEVAKPKSGVMMELTAYEIAEKMLEGDNGCFYAVDGSTEVLSE